MISETITLCFLSEVKSMEYRNKYNSLIVGLQNNQINKVRNKMNIDKKAQAKRLKDLRNAIVETGSHGLYCDLQDTVQNLSMNNPPGHEESLVWIEKNVLVHLKGSHCRNFASYVLLKF